jgi:PiT family inorganic phosphate transporter
VIVLLLLLTALLAYANGGNDVSRGIATLVGSGVTNFRRAVIWGTLWTLAGGLTAAAAAQGLVATFSGKGFLAQPDGSPVYLGAVATGATAWVLFASRFGLPVSTTHSIVGALAGAAMAGHGWHSLQWGFIAERVAVPLLLSPVLSLALLYGVFPLLRPVLARVNDYCLCLERRRLAVAAPAGLDFSESLPTSPVIAPGEECETPSIAGRLNLVDGLHWFSSGLTSFARGLNDTPKIVALGIMASAVFGASPFSMFAAVAAAMALGSLIAGFRVTETLACRVTPMSPTEGFSANAVTSLLVGSASTIGLPVSTTHVSSGAIIGIGLHRGTGALRWGMVRDMALAWVVTVPAGAVLGATAHALLRHLG